MSDTKKNDLNKLSEICVNFREKFFENLQALYESEQLCDVILIADEKRNFSQNRVILSAATPYFAAMFTNDLKEKNQTEIPLREIHGNELKMLIDFCYTGLIDINETNVFELLETASRIEFTFIENTCARFLRDKLNVSNCLMTWTLTEPFANLKELTELALTLVEKNFIEVADTHEFLLLGVNHLSTLLSSDGLNVYSEEEVFNALSKWVRYDRENRKCNVKDLLKNIRFSQLKIKFLSENVSEFCDEVNELDLMKDLVYQWKVLLKIQSLVSPRPSTSVKRIIAIGNETDLPSENRCSEIYCPTTNKWKIFDEFKCERDGFFSVVLGSALFILGGFFPKGKDNLKSVEKYDFSTRQLKEVGPMNKGRSWHAATVLNNEIFVAGGSGLNSVEKFDPENGKWSEVPSMLQSRKNLVLVSVSGRIFAVGGRGNEKEDLNSVECYDLFKNKWEFIAPMNRKRCSHSVAVHKNRLFAIGGIDGKPVKGSVEFYDPNIDKWTMIESLTVPRYGFSLINVEDFVIVVGGAEKDCKPLSSVIKINLEKLSKENISSMNFERSYFNLIEMPRYNPDN